MGLAENCCGDSRVLSYEQVLSDIHDDIAVSEVHSVDPIPL